MAWILWLSFDSKTTKSNFKPSKSGDSFEHSQPVHCHWCFVGWFSLKEFSVLVAMSTPDLTLSRFKLVNIALIIQRLIRFASSPLIFRNFLFFHQSNSTLFDTKSFFSFAGDDQLPCNSRSLFTNSFKRSKSPAQDSLKFADISSQDCRTPNSTFQ